MEIQFRRLEPWDLEAAWNLERAVFQEDTWTREQLAGELNSPSTFYAGAFSGEKLIGMAGLRGFHEADVMTIGVLEEFRGQGVGKRLVQTLTEAADQIGWRPLFLEVRASNSAAIRLYEDAGFTVTGRARSYYRNPSEDALRMKRN